MNKYDTIKGFKYGKFRRITGVKRVTFDKMVMIEGNLHSQTQEVR
jgi:hypothetical protein